jgi:hypothetical protein
MRTISKILLGLAISYFVWSVVLFASHVHAQGLTEGSSSLHLAFVAAFVTIATPLLTVFASSYSRRSDRAEDRKDRAEAAKLLVESNAAVAAQVTNAAEKAEKVATIAQEAATLLVESNTKIALAAAKADADATIAAARTDSKLDQIHILVNNNLTTHIAAALDGLVSAQVSMDELFDLKKSLKQPIAQEALVVREAIGKRIAELRQQLADRQKAVNSISQAQADHPVEKK